MSPPCFAESDHRPRKYAPGELERSWKFYKTPGPHEFGRQTLAIAVAIDCEMGTADSGESELIRVTILEYFSGQILLDSLVWPDVKMKHYNTRFSGITRKAMYEARDRKACLFGRHNARKAIWNHVGPDTIVVGHGANSDLLALRWIHHRVIDTLLVEEAASNPHEDEGRDAERGQCSQGEAPDVAGAQKVAGETGLSLKALAHRRLSRYIQAKGRGHDSIEDALASRDLLHWHVTNRVMQS